MHGKPNLTERGEWIEPRPDTVRVLGGFSTRPDQTMDVVYHGVEVARAQAKAPFHAEVLRHRKRLLLAPSLSSIAAGREVDVTVHRSQAGTAFECGAESLRNTQSYHLASFFIRSIQQMFPLHRLTVPRIDWSIQIGADREIRRLVPRIAEKLQALGWKPEKRISGFLPGLEGDTFQWTFKRQRRLSETVCILDQFDLVMYDAHDLDGRNYWRFEVRERLGSRAPFKDFLTMAPLTYETFQDVVGEALPADREGGTWAPVGNPERLEPVPQDSRLARRVGIGRLVNGLAPGKATLLLDFMQQELGVDAEDVAKARESVRAALFSLNAKALGERAVAMGPIASILTEE